jgi:hypothetical protein
MCIQLIKSACFKLPNISSNYSRNFYMLSDFSTEMIKFLIYIMKFAVLEFYNREAPCLKINGLTLDVAANWISFLRQPT